MASKLNLMLTKAAETSKVLTKNAPDYYKKLLEKNKHHIKEPPTIENCRLLSNQRFYTNVASIPHRYQSFLKEVESVKSLWKNRKDIKIEDVGIATLFGLECMAWFFGGEIVGRGFTFTGYKV